MVTKPIAESDSCCCVSDVFVTIRCVHSKEGVVVLTVVTVNDLKMCHLNYTSKVKFVKNKFLNMCICVKVALSFHPSILIMCHNQHVAAYVRSARLV